MIYSRPKQASRGGPPGTGPGDFYRRRQRRRLAIQVATDLPGLILEHVVNFDGLLAAFDHLKIHGGQAPGPDGLTYDQIGRCEICAILRELVPLILAGRYRPGAGRTLEIAKRLGGTRTLVISNLLDRIVAATAARALTPGFDDLFLPCSHGFREKRGTWTLLANLIADMVARQFTVLAIDDIRKAFDHVPIATLVETFARQIHDERLLGLIEAILRGGDDRDRSVGIPQGSPLSPLALNVLLHHEHDQPLEDQQPFPSRFRYVDNLTYLCEDAPEGERTLDHVAQLLAQTGLALKGEDGGTIDLREGEEAKLLGLTLSIRDDQLCLGLAADALGSDMGRLMTGAHESPQPHHAARTALQGWAASYGPALGGLTEDDRKEILLVAAHHGFREIASTEELSDWCATAHDRWGKLLTTTFKSHGLTGKDLSFVGTPSTTIDPGS